MTRRCVLCYGRANYGGELPSGQTVCALCERIWPGVEVLVVCGRGNIVHTRRECVQIRTTLSSRKENGFGYKGANYDDPVRTKRYGVVHNYSVCGTCYGNALSTGVTV